MPHVTHSTPDVMRPTTRLHCHNAGRQPQCELDHALPVHAPPQNHMTRAVQPDHAAAVLPQVNAKHCNLHLSPSILQLPNQLTLAG